KEHTGYPTVSGFHEFLYAPETPLKGDLTEYAYHQRGCLAYVIELWDLFAQIGMKQPKPFVDVYTHLDRKDFEALAKFDRDVNRGRVFKAWRKAKHPQLGDVEVGGLDLRVGVSNPPYEKLAEVCEKQSAAFLRVASLLPRVSIERVSQEKLGDKHTRIELRIANRGYLGTYGLSSAKKLPHAEPLRLTAECEGARLSAPSESVIEVGHLDGWGQGLYNGPTVFAPWTRGSIHERFVTLVAEGKGRVNVRVGSCRVGYKTLAIDV
ncbi:MAG: peptidase M14, partial [Bacillota bacterium]